jgi:hypothetical protein
MENLNKYVQVSPLKKYIDDALDADNYCDTQTVFEDLINNKKMMTITEILDDEFFNDFRKTSEQTPFSEICRNEEIYYLPSLESEMGKDCAFEKTKKSTISSKIKSEEYQNINKIVGFTDSDIQELRNYRDELLDIFSIGLSKATEKKRFDELNEKYMNILKEKRFNELQSKK